MVCSCPGLQQGLFPLGVTKRLPHLLVLFQYSKGKSKATGALVEENINVERFASMPLVSDFLDVLHRTWGQWSLSSRFVLKRLSSKKHLPDVSAGQSNSAEDSRNVEMQASRTTQARNQPIANTKAPNSYSSDEVSLHSNPNDCWIVIKDKVYDVSKFGQQHPGGSVIYTHAGRDATDIFATFHAPSTWKLLQQFYIGDQRSVEPTPELLKDYRKLRAVFLRTHLFKSSKFYYAFKCLTNAALLAASITIISLSQSLQSVLLSAFLMGLCFQQCGWLSHDFLHHQVFETRWLNNVVGYIIGNVVLGFSTSWWKNKHNLHHAAPNECDQTYKPIDEDIDTLPLLAWSKDILKTVDSKMMKSILQWQHVFFFPILMFARFSWLLYSWLYCNRADMPLSTKVLEKGTILVHYCWFIGTAFWLLPPSMAITWLLVSELITGTLLGLVFVLSHNGMEVYNSSKDFVNAQVASTRDIKANMFNNWFTGGLNRQIEHHLFPTMPRHNLNKISSHVQALCEKHGLVYEDIDIALGTYRVVETLAEVAAAAAAS